MPILNSIHQNIIFPPALKLPEARRNWWKTLPDHWRQVFLQAFFQRMQDDIVSDSDLENLCSTPVLRIVGPEGMHSNYSGTLTDLSGLSQLTTVQYLFVIHCDLESLDGIERMTEMRSLYLHNNKLQDIHQIGKMASLQEIFVADNEIKSISPVKNCRMLHTLSCERNRLQNLDGIKPFHEKHLRTLKCRPNEFLPQREILRVQNEIGIICQ